MKILTFFSCWMWIGLKMYNDNWMMTLAELNMQHNDIMRQKCIFHFILLILFLVLHESVSSSPSTSYKGVFSGVHMSGCSTYHIGLSSWNVTLPSRGWTEAWFKIGIVFLLGVNENMSCWISARLPLALLCSGLAYSWRDEFMSAGHGDLPLQLCTWRESRGEREQETSKELLSHFSSAFYRKKRPRTRKCIVRERAP